MNKNRESEHAHGPDCDRDHAAHGHFHGTGQQYRREEPKLGRNDPCPCGKKFKKCHGAAAAA